MTDTEVVTPPPSLWWRILKVVIGIGIGIGVIWYILTHRYMLIIIGIPILIWFVYTQR